MSHQMSDQEMIDSLLSTNSQLRERIKTLEFHKINLKEIIDTAIEGLNAIEEYGNSQEIASKTIQQMVDLNNN